jgi:hypothetical protein
MAQCAKCKEFFPPEFTEQAEGSDKLCLFCKRGSDNIYYGAGKTATRKEVADDYKKLLKKLREKRSVKAIFDKSKERE